MWEQRLDKFCTWFAGLLPRQIVAACFFRVIARATTAEYGGQDPIQLTAFEAFRRWSKK